MAGWACPYFVGNKVRWENSICIRQLCLNKNNCEEMPIYEWLFQDLKTMGVLLSFGFKQIYSLGFSFSKQEYWSKLPLPSPGVFPTQGLNLCLLHLLPCRQILYHWAVWEAKGKGRPFKNQMGPRDHVEIPLPSKKHFLPTASKHFTMFISFLHEFYFNFLCLNPVSEQSK